MDENPRCGIAGSRAENRDGTIRKSAFRFHSILGEFERQAELGIVSKVLRNHAVGLPIPNGPKRVDWVSGCGMMVRREVFERVGLLDEKYFMYFEESDFALRAARAGFECWYVPASRLIHLVGQASGVTGANRAKKPRPTYWFESRWRYFEKNHSWLYAVCANVAFIVAYTIALLKRKIARKPNPDPPGLWRDFVRYNFSSRDARDGNAEAGLLQRADKNVRSTTEENLCLSWPKP
jgi:GT2 family glycosyltransferase